MKKGLFSKLILTFTIIITIAFVIVAGFLSLWFETYYFDQRKGQLLTESQFLGAAGVQYIHGNLSPDKMNDTLTYIANYLSADIWLIDNYGYVFAVSDSEHKNLIGNQILTSELAELRIGHTVEKKGLYGNYYTIAVHTFEVPVVYNGSFQGVIIMNTSLQEIREPLKKFMK